MVFGPNQASRDHIKEPTRLSTADSCLPAILLMSLKMRSLSDKHLRILRFKGGMRVLSRERGQPEIGFAAAQGGAIVQQHAGDGSVGLGQEVGYGRGVPSPEQRSTGKGQTVRSPLAGAREFQSLTPYMGGAPPVDCHLAFAVPVRLHASAER